MAADHQLNPAQARDHMGHSHGHGHHHHDNTYLTSRNKNDPGVRITRIGLYVNLGMAIAKGMGGYVFNSQALAADAIHSLTDLVSDIMTLATISYSLRPPTTRFPFGYGKIESLGALGVSGFLLSGGIMIGVQALLALSTQFFPEFAHLLSHLLSFGYGHSHSHGAEDLGPNINAAWLAAGSIVVKEWLYRATMKVAREKRSSVLASNAYHHRVDSLTAFVALLSIMAGNVFTGAQWLDPVGGLIISGMIVQAGYQNTKAALLEIADEGITQEVKEPIEKAVREVLGDFQQKGVSDAVEVQGIKSGVNYLVEVAVKVPENWTLTQMDELEGSIRERVAKKTRGTKRIAVKFGTIKAEGSIFAREYVAAEEGRELLEDEEEHDHNHDHDHQDHKHEHEHGSLTKRK